MAKKKIKYSEKDIFAHPIAKYQTLLTQAKTFFAKETETKYQPILIFVFLYLLVGQILEFISWVPSLGVLSATEFPSIGKPITNILLGILADPLFMIIGTFLIAGAIHLAVLYYKKGAAYFQTWKVVAYASLVPIIYNVFITIFTTITEAVNPWPDQSIYMQVPNYGPYYIALLIVLLMIGLIALMHTIYTEIVGISLYHKFTKQQAIIVVILPSLILFLLIIAVVIGVTMFIRS